MTEGPAGAKLDNLPDDSGPVENGAPSIDASLAAGGAAHTRRDLFMWLAVLPIILGLLVLCGQGALLFSLKQSSTDTRSLLQTNYAAWVYDLIPPINIPELIEDIREDLRAEGVIEEPAPVVTGVFWVPPTATPLSVANLTAIPQTPIPNSATPIPPQPTATEDRPEPTNTRAPTRTITPSPSPTRTFAPLLPTSTNTEEPPPPPTRTPTQTATQPPPPTATTTSTRVPPTVPPPPPYIPISPSVRGVAQVSGGCKATFGYTNNNSYPVNIELGPRNQLNMEGSPPTSFAVGQVLVAFEITWNTGGSLIWSLDGSNEEIAWCNP